MKTTHSIVAGICVIAIISCGTKEKKETDLVTFPIRGIVEEVDTTKMRVVLTHEEIPDYMAAMTMPFKVKDRSLLSGLESGDSVNGTLAVSRTESWLETLSVVGSGQTSDAADAEEILMNKVFRPGDELPDVGLLNQDGKPIRFRDYRGKVLALTFIFTRCPLPDFCIRMSSHFAKVQDRLVRSAAAKGKWHLLTLSFDPEFDTPSVLKRYGGTYGADFSHWEFATAHLEDLYKLTDGVSLSFTKDEGLFTHNLRTIVVDANGRIVEVINGNEWTPDDLVKKMTALLLPS